ncbi:MAG: chloride channel protein, partial [Rhizobiaceae bacterium]
MARRAARIGLVRRSRALMTSPRLWKPRLVFWFGALAIGGIGAGFASLANVAQALFVDTFTGSVGWPRFVPILLTPAGFVVIAWCADRFFPASQGSGIPQAIAARHLRDEEERNRFLSLRMVAGKILLTIVGLLCGASIGREGPTVQVGASIMLQTARWGGMAQARGLILAGSAAGIAAAFNTPLAGIVFAIEEMSRAYQARTNGLVLFAVILAGLASLSVAGNYTYFGVAHASAAFPRDVPLLIACGVVGGAFGAIFSMATLWITRTVRQWRAHSASMRIVSVDAGACLEVALSCVYFDGSTIATGYEQARVAIEATPK